jgi:hypothetical protein
MSKQIRSDLMQSMASQPEAILSLALIALGLVYIGIGIFGHSIPLKAFAVLYGLLP